MMLNKTKIIFLFLIVSLRAASAQTGTGGGIGGTGISEVIEESNLTNVSIEDVNENNYECSEQSSIGILEIKSSNSNQKISKLICKDELIQTKENEAGHIYLKNGLKIRINEKSSIRIVTN